MEFRKRIANVEAGKKELIKLSLEYGGARAIVPIAFSDEVKFKRYASPRKVQDSLIDLCWQFDRKIGYKGKLVDFTKAAIGREQNRGWGCQ